MSLGLFVFQVRLVSCLLVFVCFRLGWLAVSVGLCVCQVRLVSCVFGSLCVSG